MNDLQSRIANLKSADNWGKEFKSDSVTIKKWSPTNLLLEFEITLGISLNFTIRVDKWLLPEDHKTCKSGIGSL